MKKEGIVFLRSNPIEPDPRVEKEALSLVKNDFRVLVVGWDRENKYPYYEKKDFGEVYRIKIKAKFGTGIKNIRHLIRWQFGLFSFLVKKRRNYDCIHACDFDTIVPALACKLLFRKRVVYDIFDFYADMLRNVPDFLRRFIRNIDLFLIGLADAVIIADEGRREQISGSKPKKLVVIYNSPNEVNTQDIDNLNDFTIAYVGLLQKERGIKEMVEVVSKHKDWNLIIGGFGGDEEEIRELSQYFDNIKFVGRVSYKTALDIYSKSTVLFATYDPKIPNHRYSSANKLFEAMMLGKPIIVAKNTGMDLIVDKYKLGFIVDYGDIKQIEAVLIEISSWNKDELQEFSERVKMVYRERFAWNIMEQRLIKLYTDLCEGI
jgi:glycosyltransferase involved in cell wall biosynthesis